MEETGKLYDDGNARAIELMSKFRARLYVDAMKLCHDPIMAESLVLHVIDSALRNYNEKEFGGYNLLKTILRNLWFNETRSLMSQATILSDISEMSDNPGFSTNETDDAILRNSDSEAVREAIGRLAPEYKKTVVMHYMMDMPLKEIAKVLKRPIGTVKWRLSVAKSVLAGMLKRSFGRPGTWMALALGFLVGCTAAVVVMRLPARKPDDPNGGIVYNTPRVNEITVRRAPGEVEVDGDLGEWTAPVFEAVCNPPYDRDYRASIRMMWDDKRLYIGGDIRTPDPLRNRSSALGMHQFAGGSVICRLAADDSSGWPLPVSSYYWTYKLPSAEYPDEKLVSLVMYHDAVTDSERFYAHKRMCSQQILDVPSGSWRGACREHADNRGYTFEYAIEWEAAGMTPPAPGEARANTWNIHFSNAEGVFCTGQISENFVNGISKGYGRLPLQLRCYFPPLWGRVVFE